MIRIRLHTELFVYKLLQIKLAGFVLESDMVILLSSLVLQYSNPITPHLHELLPEPHFETPEFWSEAER